MYELTRGYAAAVLDEAEEEGSLPATAEGLGSFHQAIAGSERLRGALTDASIPVEYRGAVTSDLLEPKVHAKAVALAAFAVVYERPPELPKACDILFELAGARARLASEGRLGRGEEEPAIGRSGGLERLRGYAERIFERIDQDTVDEIEDETFRLARIVQQNRPLRDGLSSPDRPLPARLGILDDLIGDKVHPETLALTRYLLRAGRVRDLVGALDYLVELAAAERGRRVADVRAAVELDDDERERLSAALSRRMRRPVELRVVIEPSVIGGLDVSVGDTVIDGTVRHRLERLREALSQPDAS